MNEMTPLEAAKNLEYIDKAVLIKGIGRQYDNLRASVTVAASHLRKIASGEYAPVVHVKPKKITPQAPHAMFETICPKCGSMGFASDEYCAMCGAVFNGKDDSHEVN